MNEQAAGKETFYPLPETWPELKPDPQAMKDVSRRMSQRLKVLTGHEGEAVQEGQFRMLSWIWGIMAFGSFVAWPRLSDLLAEYPFIRIVITCIGGLACLAPLIVIPMLWAENGDEAPARTLGGGRTPC